MKCASSAPFGRDECCARRNLLVRRAPQSMNQAPEVPLVKHPSAHAGTPQRIHAGQVDATLPKFLEYLGWIIISHDADQSRARLPHRCAKSAVQQRTTWLPHTRRSIGKHHVVDE